MSDEKMRLEVPQVTRLSFEVSRCHLVIKRENEIIPIDVVSNFKTIFYVFSKRL